MQHAPILLIEDDEIDRERIERFLGAGVADIRSAPTAAKAQQLLAAMLEAGEAPACILLDFHLPDRDGLELLPELVESGSPVVMLTGEGNEHVAVEAMKLGAEDYLPKADLTAAGLSRSIANAGEKARLRAELADRQAELEAFATVVSHDLRSPMATLMMWVETIGLAAEDGDQAALEHGVTETQKMIERMSKMIENLHEYTVIGRRQKAFETVDLNEIFEQIAKNGEGRLREAGGELKIQQLPAAIEGDPVALGQLFENLVSNAIKYRKPEVPPVIEVSSETAEDGMKQIVVRDNGLGISAEDAAEVFKPFFRVRTPGKRIQGSGLGLALCAKIVEQHGGRIRVESKLGEGSAFVVELP